MCKEHICKYCGRVEAWFEDCVKDICLSCDNLKGELACFNVPFSAIVLIAVDLYREDKLINLDD